ncbi:DNA polymerase III subunit gamma/tau [Lentilactobacillus sp. Marseille-Q4993]|uniref:DNA polymerase III subunit gamma/tau n=1 Tax=Lentilactobacillus sp. Marseille-Q4993 TaxID=3039492 RepID=UPI0024BD3EEA|nr:DNA polymerase III subunit gamma/tau [Lentilactobacillus sp. Marseille-Q4993]
MSYQALYRVWRPQRFDEIVGQEIITQTLKNALITNQTSHAYLFTGPRGTGKTSAAKIFAKAVNCHFRKDGEPCNECETCKAITDGSLSDVIEIDAASNNGVEEIRDIRDKVKYAPTQADYKVYIIDEVHMLSTGAFNALLKTLEEPPANVIFILATTEPHKIPATIISRTQRFDFKRIKPQVILKRMEYILNEKNVEYDDKALRLIAKSAEGGMRDALSILDQAMSYGDNQITYDNALLVTGSVKNDLLLTYMKQIIDGQTTDALKTVQQIIDEGSDPSRFVEDVTGLCQDILLYNQDPEMVEAMELGIVDDSFKDLAGQTTNEMVYQMINALNDVANSLRFTNHPDVYLEVLTVKMATRDSQPSAETGVTTSVDDATVQQLNQTISQLSRKVNDLESKLDHQGSNESAQAVKPEIKPANAAPKLDSKVELTKIYPILDSATRNELNQFKQVWPELMNSLSVTQRAVMHVSEPVAASDDGVIVSFEYLFLYQKAKSDIELRDALENSLDRIVGKVPKLVFVPESQWPDIRSGYLKNNRGKKVTPTESVDKSEAPQSAEVAEQPADMPPDDDDPDKDPVVDKAEELFGPDVVDVKED